MTDIELPVEPAAPSVEDQLRAALYGACTYHRATRITSGHRVGYIVSEAMWQRAGGAGFPAPCPVTRLDWASPPHGPRCTLDEGHAGYHAWEYQEVRKWPERPESAVSRESLLDLGSAVAVRDRRARRWVRDAQGDWVHRGGLLTSRLSYEALSRCYGPLTADPGD